MSKIVGIVQARLNSSRLPGKMLFDLNGKPALQHVLERLGSSQRMDSLIVATSESPADQAIASLCDELSIQCVRGSEQDVLERMCAAAKLTGATTIVRLCGDNPVQDGEFVDAVIDYQDEKGGYVGAMPGFSKGLPAGFSVEVFPASSMEKARLEDSTDEGREHVTPYIRKGLAGISVEYMDVPNFPDATDVRVCLDCAEDYLLLKKIFNAFDGNDFRWTEAIDLLNATPQWKALNAKVQQHVVSSLTPDERLKKKNSFDGNLVKGGVKAFNKDTKRDKHLANRAKAVSKYMDPETGELHAHLTCDRACPICDSSDSELLFTKEGFQHRRCTSCHMIYVGPCLAEEKLHSHAMSEESWFKVLSNENQLKLDQRKFAYGLDELERFLPERGTLIDIGCGPGIFLKEAMKRGWDVHGVEFNDYCISLLEAHNIPVSSVPLSKAQLPPASFQAASAWDVLEHVLEPVSFIREIKSLLSPDGIFLVAVPNAGSLVSRILHGASATFAGETHVNFFTPDTLQSLLEREGFEVLHKETYLTELGTINNHLNYEDPYLGSGSPVLDCLTPEYLHDNLLGSRMLLLARSI